MSRSNLSPVPAFDDRPAQFQSTSMPRLSLAPLARVGLWGAYHRPTEPARPPSVALGGPYRCVRVHQPPYKYRKLTLGSLTEMTMSLYTSGKCKPDMPELSEIRQNTAICGDPCFGRCTIWCLTGRPVHQVHVALSESLGNTNRSRTDPLPFLVWR